jgi:hypothetical protein
MDQKGTAPVDHPSEFSALSVRGREHHCYRQSLQCFTGDVKVDFANAISVLGCVNDDLSIMHGGVGIAAYNDKKGWPDIRHIPNWCTVSAENWQIEVT